MHMRTFEQNRLWSWGWSLSSRGRITARTGFNYFYGDWLISPSAMEPIRFSQKCKPSPTSPPDMLRNALNVIQRISISNRPWSGGSPYFWHDDVLMLLLPPPPPLHWVTPYPVLWHTAHRCQFPFLSSLPYFCFSLITLFLLLSVFRLLFVPASANSTHAWQSQSRKLLQLSFAATGSVFCSNSLCLLANALHVLQHSHQQSVWIIHVKL